MSRASQAVTAESRAGAGAAGIGGGTLLVAIANAIPDDSPLQLGLMLVAPSAAITLSGLWLWVQVEIANYLQGRKAETLVKKTREALEAAYSNPNVSESFRKGIRRKLEDLELSVADLHLERLEALSPISVDDVLEMEAKLKEQ